MVRRQLAATRIASGNQTEADPKVRQPGRFLTCSLADFDIGSDRGQRDG